LGPGKCPGQTQRSPISARHGNPPSAANIRAAAGSQFCAAIDYYSCIVSAERGQTCPNGCSGEERDGFYVSEEDKCAKQFGRPDGELCIDRHGFDPDPDCAANAPDPNQCPGKVVDEHKCRYGSFNGCMETSTRTWQSCKGSPDDCEKFRFDEDEFCKSLSGRPGAKSPAL
jgi:hypothetical protein